MAVATQAAVGRSNSRHPGHLIARIAIAESLPGSFSALDEALLLSCGLELASFRLSKTVAGVEA